MTERTLPIAFTPDASRDLEEVAAFRARHRGDDEAEALLARLRERLEPVQHLSLSGARPRELGGQGEDYVRQVIVGPYRLVYEAQMDRLLVIFVADRRRDTQRLLRERLAARDRPARAAPR